jgi:hypothetical protein
LYCVKDAAKSSLLLTRARVVFPVSGSTSQVSRDTIHKSIINSGFFAFIPIIYPYKAQKSRKNITIKG